MSPGVVSVLAAAEWLRADGAPGWAVLAVMAAVVATVAAVVSRPRRTVDVAAAVAALVVGGVVGRAALEIREIECCWPALRERRLTAASEALGARLERAVRDARRLANAGVDAATLERREAFAALARAPSARGAEQGVAVLAPGGEPWVWAGRHRAVPAADSAELSARITPFYVVLEARRQTPAGGVAVGSVLLSAVPRPADPYTAVASAFAADHQIDVRITAPSAAPRDSSVFDYIDPTSTPGDTLFSVQLVPPGQGGAKLATFRAAGATVLVTLAAALLVFLVAAPPGIARWAVLAATVWAATRAALSAAVPLGGWFSPATFFRSVLGDFSASAPALAATAFVALVAGWALWERGVARRRAGVITAAILLLAAPFLVRYLGRGIAPPASGVGIGLWVTWQMAVAAVAMAFGLVAAALVRGVVEPRRVHLALPLAIVWAAVVAAAGLWLWGPTLAWPEWYTYCWLPALIGIVLPAPRRGVLVGVAAVAGSAAALVTWGAALEGRLALGYRDAHRLGGEGDPVAVALLERLGHQAADARGLAQAGDLYRFWVESPLAAQDYPAILGLWEPDGRLRAEIRLAPLDLPPALLAALVGSLADSIGWRVERLTRIPGVHYVLIAPLPSGERLVVGVGPRTRLLPPDRVARFLRGEAPVEPPYTIALSLPDPSGTTTPERFWTRAGWSVRGERRMDFPGGPRHVHVRVDLGRPSALMVRGALVVLADLVLLGLAWLVARVVASGWQPGRGGGGAEERWVAAAAGALVPDARGVGAVTGAMQRLASYRSRLTVGVMRLPAALRRASYRRRLTVALTGFLGVPLLAFALWSFARLGDEARRAGDLLVGQALRDAALAASRAALESPSAEQNREIIALGHALDAELWLYRGSRLAGASAPVLDELGLVDAFLDPDVFGRLAFEDEIELTADGRVAGRPLRVGYRVMGIGPSDALTVLAAPQLLDDERVRRQQEDLAMVLALVTILGIVAAVVLGARAARGLERPVTALRVAAEAVGRGRAPPPFPELVPAEFSTVVSAFERMADDVRRSQDAIEEARQRMASVLANVATAVIAVDAGGRVTLANPRAVELLGEELGAGDELRHAAPASWAPVWDAVRRFLVGNPDAVEEQDFEIDGRQIRVQLASLGAAPDGCVIALDDITELSRAARVLAWGEMARQVAHEIKNPLTPIRLGMQHLLRVRDRAEDFDRSFTETTTRILAEIDRLDAIARAFSRFGAPAADRVPLEAVNLVAVAREVVQLYALGAEPHRDAARFTVTGSGGAPAQARRDEVMEVLVNLLENARQAGARQVTVNVADDGLTLTVSDDGRGIAPGTLSRVFEPAFSTTSSGSGLGLAIARRLVESWGGEIGLLSTPEKGTRVWLRLRAAAQHS